MNDYIPFGAAAFSVVCTFWLAIKLQSYGKRLDALTIKQSAMFSYRHQKRIDALGEIIGLALDLNDSVAGLSYAFLPGGEEVIFRRNIARFDSILNRFVELERKSRYLFDENIRTLTHDVINTASAYSVDCEITSGSYRTLEESTNRVISELQPRVNRIEEAGNALLNSLDID